MINKTCKKCNLIKPVSEFYKDRGSHESMCKQCKSAEYKKRYAANPQLFLTRNRRWVENNPDRARDIVKRWDMAHPELKKKSWKEYPDRYPGRPLAATLRWQAKNPEKLKEVIRRSNAKRLSTPKGKINNSISGGVRRSLKNGVKARRHWEDILGYTADQLRKHLEKQFTPEMTWANCGNYWEIDHKIPIAVFNFNKPEDIDFKRCWDLENLQPLEARENVRKHAKVDIPFQPSLAIAAFISGGGIRRGEGSKE